MSVTLLFTAHNRLEYVRASFETLLANTDWDHVERLVVLDDASTDGTADWLAAEVSDFYGRTGHRCDYETAHFGGPVGAMNHLLDQGVGRTLAKIDSDVIVCPGWLQAMLEVLDGEPSLDVLGMEPGFGAPLRPGDEVRSFASAAFVGGVGLIRTRIFTRRQRPRLQERFYGWTHFQRAHATCGWVTPDLPVFLLDHLPFEPWRSLAARYVVEGWSRPWPVYPEGMRDYWAWWAREREGAVA